LPPAVIVLRMREVAVEVTWTVETLAADDADAEAAEEREERTLLAEALQALAVEAQAVRALLAEEAAEESEAEALLAEALTLLEEALEVAGTAGMLVVPST